MSGKELAELHLKNAFSKRMETSAEGVEWWCVKNLRT